MAIYRLLQQSVFDDVAVKAMADAYEAAFREFGLANRADPLTNVSASKIIEIARLGVHDPAKLCERAMAELREG